jgi:predicted ATPase
VTGVQTCALPISQSRQSNGETTMRFLENNLAPNALYLLDEPEVSLSPENQVKLAEIINQSARLLNNQFIIATHSPFMLGILNAKFYDLGTKNFAVKRWTDLDNVRYFYNFFEKHKKEFNQPHE